MEALVRGVIVVVSFFWSVFAWLLDRCIVSPVIILLGFLGSLLWRLLCWLLFLPASFAVGFVNLFGWPVTLVVIGALVIFRRHLLDSVWSSLEAVEIAYDDFVLNNEAALRLEQGWADVRQLLYGVSVRLRYNRVGDAIVRFFLWLDMLPFRIADFVLSWKFPVVFAGFAFLWFNWTESLKPEPIQLWETAGAPEWIYRYQVLGERHQVTTAKFQDWPDAIGNRPTTSSEPIVTVSIEPQTITVFVAEASMSNKAVMSASEPAQHEQDYWAPKAGKTILESEEMVWCRTCQQFHCCELPY